jgi:hypothetical protein
MIRQVVGMFYFFSVHNHTPHQLLGDHVKVVVSPCDEYEARNYGMSRIFLTFGFIFQQFVWQRCRSLLGGNFERSLEVAAGRGTL